MLRVAVLALLSCLAWSPTADPATTGAPEVVARVSRAGQEVAVVVAIPGVRALVLASGGGTTAPTPEQVLTTTVQDPGHPGEPWVVTTYRRPDESFEAFIRRHKDMVEAVRKALAG